MPIELRLDDGALRRYLTGPQSDAVRLVRDGQRTTLNAAKTGSPVDTGQLRNSHRAGPIRIENGVVTADVEVVQDYAMAVHEGSRPHVIRPRRVKALTFKLPGVGRVFAKSVNHPGAKPRPWLLQAAQANASRLGFVVSEGSQ